MRWTHARDVVDGASAVKYIVQVEIDPETGIDVEAQPDKIQEMIGKWQALKPIGFYFSLTRRAVASRWGARIAESFTSA